MSDGSTKTMSEVDRSVDWKFNALFFRRLWYLWWQYLCPRLRCRTSLLLFLLLTMAVLEQFIAYQVGMLPSGFYKVLGDKDQPSFWRLFILAVCIIIGIAGVLSTKQYVASVLYLKWRESLTHALHFHYFRSRNYYNINVLCTKVDNPDQRMTQDVDRLCQKLSLILPVLVIWPFTTGYYMYKAYEGSGYVGPVSAVVFFLISCICNKFILTPTVRFYARQEKCEGDFRFKHMQLRSHAESMAFFDSGIIEETKTNEKLAKLLQVQSGLILREYGLKFAVNLCDYIGSILSYLNIAMPIFLGAYDDLSPSSLAALISKNAFVSIYLISRFTAIIDLSNQIPDIAGTTHRIGELLERLREIRDAEKDLRKVEVKTYVPKERYVIVSSSDSSGVSEVNRPYLIQHVTVALPSGQIILKDFSLGIVAGLNVMISGESGCGKTTLLRVMNNLWPIVSGKLECNITLCPKRLVFLPQKPFFTNGTLRTQICYPEHPQYTEMEDANIESLLKETKLTCLVDRYGGLDLCELNWYDVLSPGEQQRLSFVRLFYHHPLFAMLDEATSQLSLKMEETLYNLCRERCITCISVGHRESLWQYHDLVIEITRPDMYTILHKNEDRDIY